MEALDYLFESIHLAIIGINLFGWIWKRTRKLNLMVICGTFIFWFGFGLMYGIGYCPITDWHWQIKSRLGITQLPNSYIKYLLDGIFGYDFDPQLVDVLTFVLFFAALVCSLVVNIRDIKKGKP